MYKKIQNISFSVLSILIGIIFMKIIPTLQNNILKVILYPHKIIVELFYNLDLNYVDDLGYYCNYNNFAITLDCMGYRFITLIFIMLICVFISNFKGIKNKFFWSLFSLIISIIIGLIATFIRIIGSVPFVNHSNFVLLHSVSGTTIHLVTLILIYNITKKFLKVELNYES